MNILVVSGQWTTEPRAGGVQTSVCTLVEALSQNHSITVLVTRWRNKQLVREQHAEVTVYRRRLRYPHGNKGASISAALLWLLSLPATLRDLRRIVHNHQIEVVHLHQLQWTHFTFAILRMLGGPPYVATFHGRDVRDYVNRPWLLRKLISVLARHTSTFTAVSEPLARLAEQTIPGVSDVRVVLNGVAAPPAAIKHTEPMGWLPEHYFMCIGRLYPLRESLKGQDLVIRAWAKLRSAHPHLHLLLAGTDESRRDYEQLAANCGVADRVHILGALPRHELFSLMKGARGIVTASRSEGGSPTMTILEAGSLGLPLIASAIPAHTACLRDNVDSLLVPAEDPDSIAEAVDRLVAAPDLAMRLGAALRHQVETVGSSEAMAEAYVTEAYLPAVKAAAG